ncbi:MAG: spore coat polysaccharide biosynthesis protein SpsF (cytidylyltransferase family), partial [Psychroserpens sp.]
EQYAALAEMEFINESEIDYLEKSIQIPILKKDLIKGEGIIFPDVFEFKRSGKRGLNVKEIKELINEKYILSENVEKTNPLRKENFKKAIIGTIIAGRLKSSRLKRKALLKIGELTSIELCIKNCLNFRNTNYTILATSDNNEDNELKEFTYSKSVLFHTGHPEDVIKRYLSIIDEKDIDVIIRVTADMPFVSSEITDLLLKSHFESGADYTAARNVAVGTAPEIINAKALREVKKHFPNAEYSEYMTWYFQNNAEYFRINIIDLPNSLIRDYRLTLDYQEDLELFNLIQNHLNKNKLDSNIKNIFNFMDSNPDSAKINSHLTLKYKTDEELINRLNDQTKIREK